MTDQLVEITQKVSGDILNANGSGILEELLNAEEGKLTVGVSLKLTKTANRIYCTGDLSYSRKFKDQVEDSIEVDDPNQPKLGGFESVTISTPGTKPIVLDAQFAQNCDKVLKEMKKKGKAKQEAAR